MNYGLLDKDLAERHMFANLKSFEHCWKQHLKNWSFEPDFVRNV